MIETMFYFAGNEAEYNANKSQLNSRVISFVPESSERGSIYKAGVKYGGVSTEELTEIIQNTPSIIPFANKDKAGIIKLGNGLVVGSPDGTVNVDFSNVTIPGLNELIISLIGKYIGENPSTLAGSQVSFRQILSEADGIAIGTITIDGKSTIIYAPAPTSTSSESNVSVVCKTTNGDVIASINGINIYNGVSNSGSSSGSGSGSGSSSGDTGVQLNQPLSSINNQGLGIPVTPDVAIVWTGSRWAYRQINNGSGSSTPGGGGSGSDYDDTEIRNRITDLEQDLANRWLSIDGIVSSKVAGMITDAAWIRNNFPKGVISWDESWNPEIGQYLNTVAEWSDFQTNWSQLKLRIDAVEASVNALTQIGNGDIEAFRADLEAYIRDVNGVKTAVSGMSSLYAVKDTEDVIKWLYSSLSASANKNATWTEIVSAAKNKDGLGGISQLRTSVESFGDTYIAKNSLVAAIEQEKNSIATTLASAGLINIADLNNTSSTLYSKIGEWYAAIETAVKKDPNGYISNASIKADKIILDGTTFAQDIVAQGLSSGTATISGNVYAKKAVLGNGLGMVLGETFNAIKIGALSSNSIDGDVPNPWIKISNSEAWFRAGTGTSGGYTTYINGGALSITDGYHMNDSIIVPGGMTKGTVINSAYVYLKENGVTCTYSANGPATSSDMRRKNVVEDVNLTVDQISDSPLFRYTSKKSNDGSVFVGTSAQYWQEVLPEAVSEDQEGYLSLNYTTVATASAISTAREVVKLREENKELKQRLAAVEAFIANLKQN